MNINQVIEYTKSIDFDGLRYLLVNGYKFEWDFNLHQWKNIDYFPPEAEVEPIRQLTFEL